MMAVYQILQTFVASSGEPSGILSKLAVTSDLPFGWSFG